MKTTISLVSVLWTIVLLGLCHGQQADHDNTLGQGSLAQGEEDGASLEHAEAAAFLWPPEVEGPHPSLHPHPHPHHRITIFVPTTVTEFRGFSSCSSDGRYSGTY